MLDIANIIFQRWRPPNIRPSNFFKNHSERKYSLTLVKIYSTTRILNFYGIWCRKCNIFIDFITYYFNPISYHLIEVSTTLLSDRTSKINKATFLTGEPDLGPPRDGYRFTTKSLLWGFNPL